MKYHVSVDCQESDIFPRDYIFPRENITILAPPTRDISSVPVDICYIRWSTTILEICVQNKTERKLDSLRAFYYDVLLLTTAYSAYAVYCLLGQFPNMELTLLLLLLLFLRLRHNGCYNSVFDRLSMRAWAS